MIIWPPWIRIFLRLIKFQKFFQRSQFDICVQAVSASGGSMFNVPLGSGFDVQNYGTADPDPLEIFTGVEH